MRLPGVRFTQLEKDVCLLVGSRLFFPEVLVVFGNSVITAGVFFPSVMLPPIRAQRTGGRVGRKDDKKTTTVV